MARDWAPQAHEPADILIATAGLPPGSGAARGKPAGCLDSLVIASARLAVVGIGAWIDRGKLVTRQGSGIAEPSARGSEAPDFTFVLELYATALPRPIRDVYSSAMVI